MFRRSVVTVALVALVIADAKAEDFRALLTKVNVARETVSLKKLPKDESLIDNPDHLTETTLPVADNVKIYTPKDGKRFVRKKEELEVNPGGLAALKKLETGSTLSFMLLEVTVDEKTGKITTIKAVNIRFFEKPKKGNQ